MLAPPGRGLPPLDGLLVTQELGIKLKKALPAELVDQARAGDHAPISKPENDVEAIASEDALALAATDAA